MGDLSEVSRRGITYYDSNPMEFFNTVKDRPPLAETAWLINRFPRGTVIVDAGCGIGIDTKALSDHGMRVYAYDGSVEMVKLAREHVAGCKHPPTIHHHAHHELKLRKKAKAILAVASLIFLDDVDLCETLKNFNENMDPGGILLATFKKDNRTLARPGDERVFNRKTSIDMYKMAEMAGLEGLSTWERADDLKRPDQQWLTFVLRKPGGSHNDGSRA